MKQNIAKQLCMCMAVYKLLTALLALELPLPKEIPKHMRSSQRNNINLECSKTSIVSCHCTGAI